MKSFFEKFWRAAGRPGVRIALVLLWPLAAVCGVWVIEKYPIMDRFAPYPSIAGIICSFLGILMFFPYFYSQARFGVPMRLFLALSQLANVVLLAYFSASCITLKVLFHWTIWDNLRPQHVLPTPALYPVANLAYLGLTLSLFQLAILWWRKQELLEPF